MSAGKGNGAVAAAICFALGSTAVLSWAFSVFTEDKPKRKEFVPGTKLQPVLPSNIKEKQAASTAGDKEKPKLTGNVSVLAASQKGVYKHPKYDYIPENCFKPSEEEKTSLVIANKLATDSEQGYPSYEQFRSETTLPVDDNLTIMTINEQAISPAQYSFVQNAPRFDERYNRSLSKTSISDAVISERIEASDKPADNALSDLITQSQLDTKITTFEEAPPATVEMTRTADEYMLHMPTSVSTKSLQSAVMYAPPTKTKPETPDGVDNSVSELHFDESAHELQIPHDDTDIYDEHVKLSREVKGRSYSPEDSPKSMLFDSTNVVDERPSPHPQGVDNSISHLNEVVGTMAVERSSGAYTNLMSGVKHIPPKSADDNIVPEQPSKSTKSKKSKLPKSDSKKSKNKSKGPASEVTSGSDKALPSETANSNSHGVDNSISHIDENKEQTITVEQVAETHAMVKSGAQHQPPTSTDKNKDVATNEDHSGYKKSKKSKIFRSKAKKSKDKSKDKTAKSSDNSAANDESPALMHTDGQMETDHIRRSENAEQTTSCDIAQIAHMKPFEKTIDENDNVSSIQDGVEISSELNLGQGASASDIEQAPVDEQLDTDKSSSEPAPDCPQTSELFVTINNEHNPYKQVSQYYSPVRLERELSPDSLAALDISQDSLERHRISSQERSEMRFQLGRDKLLSSSSHNGSEGDIMIRSLSTTSLDRRSPVSQRADLFVSVGNASPTHYMTATYEPTRLERVLTPDSLTLESTAYAEDSDSSMLVRSELHHIIGRGKSTDPPRIEDTTDVSTISNLTTPDVSYGEDNSQLLVELNIPQSIDISLCAGSADVYTIDSICSVEDSPLVAEAESSALTPEGVINETLLGNDRFVEGESSNPNEQSAEAAVKSDDLPASDCLAESLAPPDIEITHDAGLHSTPDYTMKDIDSIDGLSPLTTDQEEACSESSDNMEYSRTQQTETEEMIETSVEETVTMVITGVVANPGAAGDEVILSLQDALTNGLLDMENGLYHNNTTGEKMSFIEAMNSGFIKSQVM